MNLIHKLRIKNYKKHNLKYLNSLNLDNLCFDYFGYLSVITSETPFFIQRPSDDTQNSFSNFRHCYSLEAFIPLINHLSDEAIKSFDNNMEYFKILYSNIVKHITKIINQHKLELSDIYTNEYIEKIYKEAEKILISKNNKLKENKLDIKL